MQKSQFFCIFCTGRPASTASAASVASIPSQAPLETKKAVTRLGFPPLHPTPYTGSSAAH